MESYLSQVQPTLTSSSSGMIIGQCYFHNNALCPTIFNICFFLGQIALVPETMQLFSSALASGGDRARLLDVLFEHNGGEVSGTFLCSSALGDRFAPVKRGPVLRGLLSQLLVDVPSEHMILQLCCSLRNAAQVLFSLSANIADAISCVVYVDAASLPAENGARTMEALRSLTSFLIVDGVDSMWARIQRYLRGEGGDASFGEKGIQAEDLAEPERWTSPSVYAHCRFLDVCTVPNTLFPCNRIALAAVLCWWYQCASYRDRLLLKWS